MQAAAGFQLPGDLRAVFDLNKLGSIVDLNGAGHLSAGELARRVEAGSAALSERGIGPGDRVMITHGDSPAFFVDLLALWHCGACAVCVNPGSSALEMRNLVSFTEPALILLVSEAAAEWADAAETMSLQAHIATLGAAKPAGQTRGARKAASSENPALILFTSGSTGLPKGVVHSYGSLGARLDLNCERIGRDDMARSLCLLPTHFGHGLIGNCLTPLLAGCDLFLMAGDALRSAARLGSVVDEHAITFLSSVPAFWRLAMKAGRPPAKGTLRRVHIGSAPLSADLWHQVIDWTGTANVVNMYGLTETANWVAGASALDYAPEDGLVGRPWGGEMAVADETGALNAAGEGELWLLTPSCMSGYYKQADLTGSVLRDGWLCTGDVARIEDDGTLRLTGRKRTEINRAGIKVHPEEVELLLERHAMVAEACSFGLPDPVAGELVAVAVRLEDGRAENEKELRSWCSHQIRKEAQPERWFFLSEIPRTERGKVNRQAVKQACMMSTTRRGAGGPGDC